MRKCGVERTRNFSSGSKSVAARAVAVHSDTASATRTTAAAGLDARTTRTPRLTRRTGQHEAQEERRDAEEAGTDEEQPVGLDERPSDREPLDPDAREALRELADVGVRRAQQRILRRRVAETRQARHVGHERDTGEPDS